MFQFKQFSVDQSGCAMKINERLNVYRVLLEMICKKSRKVTISVDPVVCKISKSKSPVIR